MRNWPTPLSLVIPDTSLSTHGNLMDFTIRSGFIARYAAMANVHRIIIYREEGGRDDPYGKRLEVLLKFMVIPPYLRKRLFPLNEDLKYAGLMPPINIPSHPQSSRINLGDIRVGLMEDHRAWIDANKQALVEGNSFVAVPPGIAGLTFLRVTQLSPLKAEVAQPDFYAGFFVQSTRRSLGATLRELVGLKVATSRYGEDYSKVSHQLLGLSKKFEETFVVLGSPSSDLSEIAKKEGISIKGLCDFNLNLDPGQVLKSIRTDEAIPLALITLNCLSSMRGEILMCG